MFKRLELPSQETIHMDACLSGMGGIRSNRVYSCPAVTIPGINLHINHLEMFNIVLVLRLWGQFWSNASVSIRSDNLAVVQIVQNLRTNNSILAACVCNIWFMCTVWNIDLKIEHIKGTLNVKADLLYSEKPLDQTLLPFLHRNFMWDKIKAGHIQLDLSFWWLDL